MQKDIFKRLIVDFQEREDFPVIDRNIAIPLDLNKIISLIGVRRSGKTFILYTLINKLRKGLDRRNIVYINLEDDRLFPLQLNDLNNLLESYYELYPGKKGETVYFFLTDYIMTFVPRGYRYQRIQSMTTSCTLKMPMPFLLFPSTLLLSKRG